MVKPQYKPSFFLPLFIVLVILDLVTGSLANESLRHFTKPLILFSLFIYFAVNGRGLDRYTYILMLLALFFSWLGDSFLMYDAVSSLYFMLGLLSFLLSHIIYSIVFLKRRNNKASISFWAVLAVFILYGAALLLLLKDGLGELLIPVIVYVSAILLMAITAFGRKNMVTSKSFKLVFIGALFFIASDSLLAVNKFLSTVPYAHILVMGTYATAQFLITKGVLIQEDS
ncbi:MAG: lysoplasmalogenase [Maribacter sp.]|nr:lysoplasmalogenase [Maribacter sp.]